MFSKMSVWLFVALILIVDGIIIAISGLVYWHHDGVATVARYHPSLVWGLVMIVCGAALMWFDRRS